MTFKNICDRCGKIIIIPYLILNEYTEEKDEKYGYHKVKRIGSYHHECLGFKQPKIKELRK